MLDNFQEEIANFGSAPTHVRRPGRPLAAICNSTTGCFASAMPMAQIVQDGDRQPNDYADLHRRGDAAELVPEGAVLSSPRIIRKGSIASVRWRASTSAEQFGTPRGRCRAAGIPPALRPHAALAHSSITTPG